MGPLRAEARMNALGAYVRLAALLLAVGAPALARADGVGAQSPAQPAVASAEAVAAGAPKPPPKGVQFVGVPIPLSDPALGSGVAPILMMLYTPKGGGGPWTTGVGGLYTSTRSKALGVFQRAHFDDDRYRITVFAGYGDFNLKFYGVGGLLASQGRFVEINQTGEAALAEGLVRVIPHAYVGARYFLIDTTTTVAPFQIGGITIPLPQLEERQFGAWPIRGLRHPRQRVRPSPRDLCHRPVA